MEKDSTGTFKIPAASHKEAEPQSETRGALANMLRAILKVKAGAERESYNPLNYSPDDFVSRQKVGAALNTKAANGLSATPGPIPSAAKSKQPLIIPLCGKNLNLTIRDNVALTIRTREELMGIKQVSK